VSGGLRASRRRWTTLSGLLTAFERGVDACARLDAYHPGGRMTFARHDAQAVIFDTRLRALEQRLDRELDRLTAERLRVDLAQKQGRRA
jgi:hypothetical protein